MLNKEMETGLLSFGEVLDHLRDGSKIRRVNWGDPNAYLIMNFASATSKNIIRKDYIEIRTKNGYFMPWAPSHTDLLSKDWAALIDMEYGGELL